MVLMSSFVIFGLDLSFQFSGDYFKESQRTTKERLDRKNAHMVFECSLSGFFKAKHSSISTREFCSRREFLALTFSNTVSKLSKVGLLSAS